MSRQAINILLVEDNPGDVFLIRDTLSQGPLHPTVYHVEDGESAIDLLKQLGDYAQVPQPHLILLDLNLPGMNGHELLAIIKSDLHLQHIPVIVITTSKAEEDIRKSYQLGANCYFTKPFHIDEFAVMIQTIAEFWLTYVQLP